VWTTGKKMPDTHCAFFAKVLGEPTDIENNSVLAGAL